MLSIGKGTSSLFPEETPMAAVDPVGFSDSHFGTAPPPSGSGLGCPFTQTCTSYLADMSLSRTKKVV